MNLELREASSQARALRPAAELLADREHQRVAQAALVRVAGVQREVGAGRQPQERAGLIAAQPVLQLEGVALLGQRPGPRSWWRKMAASGGRAARDTLSGCVDRSG